MRQELGGCLMKNQAGYIHELPEHLKAMVRFTLATGLRESNVTGIQWGQIDMQRRCAWIHADQAKGKKAIAVPLNNDALAVIRQQIGKHDTYVFTYKDSPVTRANNHAWRKSFNSGWHYRFSLARFKAHLGKLACTKWNTASCT